MNPVGALQELSTAHKWTPPSYNTQKLQPCKSDHKISYKVICDLLFLHTEGNKYNRRVIFSKMFINV